LQHWKLLFGGDRVGLRRGVVGLACSRPEAYCCACSTVPAPLLTRLIALVLLLLGEGERRLRLRGLFLGLLDAGLLRGDCASILAMLALA
jgi:hypothetical protein